MSKKVELCREKKPYAKPSLTVYGTVREVTQNVVKNPTPDGPGRGKT